MRILRLALAVAGAAALLSGADGDFMNCPSEPGKRVWALPVRAMGQRSQAVDGLRADNFRVKINGDSQEVCGFNHRRWPVSLGIVVDNSGSMRSTSMMPFALPIRAVAELLSASGLQDEHFLEYLGERAEVRVPFTRDANRLTAALQDAPAGRTALVDGIYLGIQQMRRARYWNRALLVLTDGGDNASVYQLDDLKRLTQSEQATIFVLAPSQTAFLLAEPRDEGPGVRELLKFVVESGGSVTLALTPKDLQAAVTGFSSALRSPYILYFTGPAAANQRKALRVESTGVKPKPDLYYGRARECGGPASPPCDFDTRSARP